MEMLLYTPNCLYTYYPINVSTYWLKENILKWWSYPVTGCGGPYNC
jgi:hypothetical protein